MTDLSNPDLDAAVAQECFGWPVSDRRHTHCGLLHSVELTTLMNTCLGRTVEQARNNSCCAELFWSPTTDARDAERVWDWMQQQDRVLAVNICRSTKESCSNDVWWYIESPNKSCESAHSIEGEPWKRALCLAALRVAREKR